MCKKDYRELEAYRKLGKPEELTKRCKETISHDRYYRLINELFHLESSDEVINTYPKVFSYQMCRKTPCFSYGDIRHVHRIYASN